GGRAAGFEMPQPAHDDFVQRLVFQPVDFVEVDDQHLHGCAHTGSFDRRAAIHDSAGNAKRVSRRVEHRPPTTTVARGRWTSDPTPVARAAGTMPSMATMIIISTGRICDSAP